MANIKMPILRKYRSADKNDRITFLRFGQTTLRAMVESTGMACDGMHVVFFSGKNPILSFHVDRDTNNILFSRCRGFYGTKKTAMRHLALADFFLRQNFAFDFVLNAKNPKARIGIQDLTTATMSDTVSAIAERNNVKIETLLVL